jgi:hypothetical protein
MTMKNRMIRMLIRWAWEKHPVQVKQALSDFKVHPHKNPEKAKA